MVTVCTQALGEGSTKHVVHSSGGLCQQQCTVALSAQVKQLTMKTGTNINPMAEKEMI